MAKTEYMTARQRVVAAVNHQQPDRVPIDLGMHFSTGISVFAYQNLRRYLGLPTDNTELIDCVQCLARVEEDVIDRFHVDTILLNPPYQARKQWTPKPGHTVWVPEVFNPVATDDGGYRLEFAGEQLYMPSNGYFFDGGWPDFYDLSMEDKHALFAKRAEKLYMETDKYTMFMGFSGYFGGLDFACDMLTDPEICIEENEKLLEQQIKMFDSVNEKMGKYINCIEINSDLGTQQGLMCTPNSYAEVCLPYLKKFCEHVHNNTDIHVFLHSCGAVSQLIPQFIEAGIDILNPVQISARGMDAQTLKAEYGDRICFWGGGCDTQTVLNNASAEEVAAHTKEQISVFKPNGGYVFNQVHNVMADIKPENIVAMYDTAYENSFYD